VVKYIEVRDVCVQLHLEETTVRALAGEGLVQIRQPTAGGDAVLSVDDAERLRVISVLMREMDVNLEGVEVILHMREEVVSMRRQFDEVVRTLVEELKKHVDEG
jgi:MerR family transcriptional regulator/heat shock protein HspR